MKEAGYVLYAIYVLLTLWLLVNGFVQLHLWKLARKNYKNKKQVQLPGKLPFISIQAPVYNERYVVEGLLDSLASLEYPKHLFEILVLDDSTDETSSIINQKVQALLAEGYQIRVVRRSTRKEYKAGALQESLACCKGEFIAIFDADFRPEPFFLKQLLPYFDDDKVGLVQARWAHSNQNQNLLTRVQSFLLDTYFAVEQAGRYQAGYFTNFCGTAGMWRKQCIEDAGGWDGTVLSEDLQLSYKAQLKGWKIVYKQDTNVPAELPSVTEAFKIQQARWTKGIAQVCRKNLAEVVASSMSFPKKMHAVFHLFCSFVFPCIFINTLLSLPLLILRHAYPEFVVLTRYSAFGALNLVLLACVFFYGTQSSGRNNRFFLHFPPFLMVLTALSVQNTVAVFEGLLGKKSAFIRTPKFAQNNAGSSAYLPKKSNAVQGLEMAVLLYVLCGTLVSVYLKDWFFLPQFLLMACGFGILIYHSHSWRRITLRLPQPKFSWR